MSGHTPGPLVARRINTETKPFAVINPNGPCGDDLIAGFLNEADAILFAAASDMEDALRTSAPHLCFALCKHSERHHPICDANRAALKKARGE